MNPSDVQTCCSIDWTILWTIIATGIGTTLSIIGINIALFSWLRSDIHSMESKINSLEERMFYLSTGKTLSQAILDEKMKREGGAEAPTFGSLPATQNRL